MTDISINNLKDKKTFLNIMDELGELDNFGKAAGGISEKLETLNNLKKIFKENPNFKKSDPEFYKEYLKILIRYKTHLIDLLSEEEILNFIENNLVDIVKTGIDFQDGLKAWLMEQPYKERDVFLEKVRDVMGNSREELGSRILLGENQAEVKGFVKNWLQDYHNELGKGRHLKIDISKYLFQSKNASRLSAEDKNILKKILEFYEKTKLKVNEPFALGTYPMSMFGVEVVGEEGSIKAKFQPREGGEIPEEELSAEVESSSEVEIPQEAGVVSNAALDKLSKQSKKTTSVSEDKAQPIKPLDIKKSEAKVPKTTPKKASESEKEVKFSLESVESIKKITPEIFRKISADPGEAAEKIKSEAAKLVQANPENIISAKEMWQLSDLYKLYIEIVREGMDTGLSIDKVINVRGKMGKPSLSKKEFGAVVELSKIF